MIIQRVDNRFEEKKSQFILEKDKDKLLTKAGALSIFATKEDLAKQIGDTKSDIIKCPPDRDGQGCSFFGLEQLVFFRELCLPCYNPI